MWVETGGHFISRSPHCHVFPLMKYGLSIKVNLSFLKSFCWVLHDNHRKELLHIIFHMRIAHILWDRQKTRATLYMVFRPVSWSSTCSRYFQFPLLRLSHRRKPRRVPHKSVRTNTRTWGVLPFLGKCKSQLRGVMARDGQLGWNKTWALFPWKSWPSQWRRSQTRTPKGRWFIWVIDKWSQFKCPQIPTSSSWLPVIRLHFNTIPTPILQEHCYEEHGAVNPGLVGTSLFVLNYFYDILLALKWFWKNLEVPK